MLLCPESEQFNPGKVFMFFQKQENYGIFAASDGKFTAAAYIVSNHIDNDCQQSYTENRYCAIAVIKYFFRSHPESPVSGAERSAVFP